MCDEMSDTQHEIEILRFRLKELDGNIDEMFSLFRELMWRGGIEDEIQRLEDDIDKAIAEQGRLLDKIAKLEGGE